jgi:hypothetical protein
VHDLVSVEVLGAAVSQQVIPELVALVHSTAEDIGVARNVATEEEEGPTRPVPAKRV